MAFDFSGKRILVTGATKGIGRELAKTLARFGAEVYALGRNEEELASLVQECGAKVIPLKVDLQDWDATRSALIDLPPMNGLVNNAGFNVGYGPSLQASKDNIEKMFSVNVYAAVNTIQIVGQKMVEAGKGGSIVNNSSILGKQPAKNLLGYCMSKAALDMMTKQFAFELGPSNIRVNSVNPAVVRTSIAIQFWSEPQRAAKLIGHTPIGRFADIEECVMPIVYLLSDCSSMVTGTTHVIDGGLLSNIET